MVDTEKYLKKLWTGVCSVYEYEQSTDEDTKITSSTEIKVLDNMPCRLSIKLISNTNQTDSVNIPQKVIKLILEKNVTIKAGSKIVVTQNGITEVFKSSGVTAIYSAHQEIILELFDRYA